MRYLHSCGRPCQAATTLLGSAREPKARLTWPAPDRPGCDGEGRRVRPVVRLPEPVFDLVSNMIPW